jgi:hypothetical protein
MFDWFIGSGETEGPKMQTRSVMIIAILAALIAIGTAAAAEKSMNLNRTAKSDVESRLAYSNRWDRNCNSLPVTITFVQKPMYGTVAAVDADEVLPAATPGSGKTGPCAGKTIKSKAIIYRSNANYRGNDIVRYDSDGNGTLIHTTIAITVQ